MRTSLLLATLTGVLLSQEPPAPQEPSSPSTPSAGAPGGLPFGGGRNAEPDPKPYDRVVTKDAKTQSGVFKVHQVRNRYYYEIPPQELGKEFLWVNQIARTTLGVGYGGQALGNRVVKWEQRGNRVLLRNVSFDVVADGAAPIARAVEASNTNSILMSFPVEAFAKDKSPVIEVTRLFTSDVPEFSARQRLRARSMDASRSFLDRVTAFPTNIEVEATQTYTASADGGSPGGGPAPAPTPANRFGGSGMQGSSATVVMHYSMVKLPEKPMQPRLFDPRVGYFSISNTDFGREAPRAESRRYYALAAGEEKSWCGVVRACEADCVLCRPGDAAEVCGRGEERD